MVSCRYKVSIYSFKYLIRRATGECTVAIAMLSEVPARFTPEASAGPSGQSALVFKGSLERAYNNLQSCFTPPHGTNIGWAEASK